MKLSVLMLTHDRLSLASKCVPFILDNLNGIEHEVLVWDNCSNDGMLDWLIEYKKREGKINRIYCSDKNYGVEAINYMVQDATGEYILKIDDDISPPELFAKRMVDAFEKFNNPKLAYLGFDMRWGKTTFATRSGMKLYRPPMGSATTLRGGDKILVNFNPSRWMINGACRLSKRSTFIELGGHPPGCMYGVDYTVSKAAADAGYWIGYLSSKRNVEHLGTSTIVEKNFKHRELKKAVKVHVQGWVQTKTEHNCTYA